MSRIKVFLPVMCLCFILSGCEILRFAPTEVQKQNAWLHGRTTEMTANTARCEKASEKLQALTRLSARQSRALSSYYGMPKELPATDTAEDLLAEANFQLADNALEQSTERPYVRDMIDGTMELVIGVSGLFGGLYGAKVVQFLNRARAKSKALEEIIAGNELFKNKGKAYSTAFKEAHKNQSPQTRQIVTQIRG